MEVLIRVVEHQGKQILLVDMSNCTPNELATIMRFVPSYVTSEPHNSVLLLADFTGAEFDRIAIDRMKESAVFDRPHLKRSAWVGIERLPKVFSEHMKSFSQRDLPTFKTRQEAMDWLVSGEEMRSADPTQDGAQNRTLGDRPKRQDSSGREVLTWLSEIAIMETCKSASRMPRTNCRN